MTSPHFSPTSPGEVDFHFSHFSPPLVGRRSGRGELIGSTRSSSPVSWGEVERGWEPMTGQKTVNPMESVNYMSNSLTHKDLYVELQQVGSCLKDATSLRLANIVC